MKKYLLISATVMSSIIVLLGIYTWTQWMDEMMMGGMASGMGSGMMGNMVRHQYLMRNGLPEEYENWTNPLPSAKETISAGQRLYSINCASCHGETGAGDGVAGKALDPPPANLAALVHMPMASDAYLLWSISDGGVQFQTAMPPFKAILPEEDRWRIIVFLQQL